MDSDTDRMEMMVIKKQKLIYSLRREKFVCRSYRTLVINSKGNLTNFWKVLLNETFLFTLISKMTAPNPENPSCRCFKESKDASVHLCAGKLVSTCSRKRRVGNCSPQGEKQNKTAAGWLWGWKSLQIIIGKCVYEVHKFRRNCVDASILIEFI